MSYLLTLVVVIVGVLIGTLLSDKIRAWRWNRKLAQHWPTVEDPNKQFFQHYSSWNYEQRLSWHQAQNAFIKAFQDWVGAIHDGLPGPNTWARFEAVKDYCPDIKAALNRRGHRDRSAQKHS